MKKLLIYCFVICILPITCFAQWSSNANENTMIVDSIGSQVVPMVVTNSLGETYISWYSEFEDLNFDLYLQKLDKSGMKLWDIEGLQISDNQTMTWVTQYDMILDQDENIILVNQDIRTGSSNIFAYKISPTGEFLWGNDGIQLSNTTGFDPAPKVTVADNNDLIFMWAEEPVDTTLFSPIFITRYSPDGNKYWETTLSDTLDFMLPQMLYTENDEVIVSWISKEKLKDTVLPGYESWLHVYAQKINNMGETTWEKNLQVDDGDLMTFLSLFTTPYLTSDKNGGAYVNWQSFYSQEDGGHPTIYVNKINYDGTLWTPGGYSVSNQYDNYHTEAEMTYLEGVEKLLVCWQEYHLDNINQIDCWGVRGQLFDKDGNQLWADTGKVFVPLMCSMDTTYGGIHIDESTDNNAILIYNKDYLQLDGADTNFRTNIYAMSFDADGEMNWTPPVVNLSLTDSDKYQAALGNLIDEQWVLAWNDNILNPNQMGDYGIYAQNISVNGELGPSGIISPGSGNTFVVYPNPATSEIQVVYNANSDDNITIDIIDMNGRLIKTENQFVKHGLNSIQVDVGSLISGQYILTIKNNQTCNYTKVIIN